MNREAVREKKPVHQHNKPHSPQHKNVERREHELDLRVKQDPRFREEFTQMQEEEDLRKIDDDVEDVSTLFAWEAPEHIHQDRGVKWFALFAGGITAIAVGFALFGNFIASLTIGMIGVYMFVVAQHKPSIIRYRLLTEGVALNNTLYHYKHLEAFNIVYEPGNVKTVILRSSRRLVPLIHMEIGTADPVAIRDILIEFVHEDVRLEEPVIDIWARRLGF
ncbi:MAG: hypothetical protein AAB649_05655 [Patescibacteria group bacterium]